MTLRHLRFAIRLFSWPRARTSRDSRKDHRHCHLGTKFWARGNWRISFSKWIVTRMLRTRGIWDSSWWRWCAKSCRLLCTIRHRPSTCRGLVLTRSSQGFSNWSPGSILAKAVPNKSPTKTEKLGRRTLIMIDRRSPLADALLSGSMWRLNGFYLYYLNYLKFK